MKRIIALALLATAFAVPSANAFLFGWFGGGNNCCYAANTCCVEQPVVDCCPQDIYATNCGC